MTPTLHEGDILVTVKTDDFKEGDIVAFYYNNKILVKRVIASSGEWVDIDDEGIVYVNNDWALNYYDIETIASSYPVWYAQYTDSPDFPVKVLLWQYTDSYKMEGVSKPIDMNLMLVKK